MGTLSVGVMAEKMAVKYFPVDVDLDKLFDWSQTEVKEGKNGVKVRVNDKDIAVFKYGDGIIAADAVCPHAGGALQAGEIEELADSSLCIKCPEHKWTFCLTSGTQYREGDCLWPPSAKMEGRAINIYHAVADKQNKTIKIAFEES